MATISGRLLFDRARTAYPPGITDGIANVAIVLQNISTNESLAVLTDQSGNYSFINVPDGNYHIVEAYGTTPAVAPPGDFANAAVTPAATAVFPPIAFAPSPPPGATNLDGVSPNTIPIAVSGNQNVINQYILNGPVTYTPIEEIMDECATLTPANLVTDAYGGTMGPFLQGTPANTSAQSEPFSQNVPDYTYVLTQPGIFVPDAQQYTVQNLLTDTQSTTIGAWWRIADHTIGNETGRMMVVNGDIPGSVIFTTTVNVLPNTSYLFSAWILNMFKVTGWTEPRLGVVVLGEDGEEIYHQTLGALIPVNTNNPQWKQIGTAISSRNNTILTVQFLSEGPEAIGNDYALDEIALQQIDIPTFTPVKSVSASTADVGDIVTYTVTLTNTCQSPLVNVHFLDEMPDGLLFEANTVTVNGSNLMGLNPNLGFDVPDIPGGGTAVITFDAIVGNVPNPNPTLNAADMTYSYTPIQGGILGEYNATSNVVPLNVNPAAGLADLEIEKTASADRVMRGDTLTYTVTVTNNGPDAAENVDLIDFLPPFLLTPEYSTDGGATFQPWTDILNLGNMNLGSVATVLIRGQVAPDAVGLYVNDAEVMSSTPDPDLTNNDSIVTVEVGPDADIAVVKTASAEIIIPGQYLEYSIDITNHGPDMAEDVVLTDIIPGDIPFPMFSIDGGQTFSPWLGSLTIGDMLPTNSQVVTIRGMVDIHAPFGSLDNQAEVNSSTPDPIPSNNTSNVSVDVQPVADITVRKSAEPATVRPGDVLAFTMVVNNFGPDMAQDVSVSDLMPREYLLDPEFSVDGVPMGEWAGSYNLGDMEPGALHTLTVTSTVAPGAAGTIPNTATALASTADPELRNNTSTVEVTVEFAPCLAVGQQMVDICLPVSVEAFAKVGTVISICCGEPVITPGITVCSGESGGNCDFTISQRVCVTVPVEFGAAVQPGEAQVQCTGEDCSACESVTAANSALKLHGGVKS